ncbi:Hypp7959 [Branchiostoma lanceolatum]|uniref:Hypp7959 protein n=1 Tax=Branchiostoma lanceolatum TaxID=7740 RepID=A0A8J9Z4L5_BRALA|nr:Hypp7959 [Branchiostoma lanceolatum]
MEDSKSRVRGSTFPESELRKIQRQRKKSTDVSASRRRVASVASCTASRQTTLQPSDDARTTKLPPIGASNRLVMRVPHEEQRFCSFGQKATFQTQACRQRKDTPAFSATKTQQECLKEKWLDKMRKQKKSSLSSCPAESQHAATDVMVSTRPKNPRGHYPPLRMLESVEKEAMSLPLSPGQVTAAVPEAAHTRFEVDHEVRNVAEPYVDIWSKMAPMRPDRTSLTTPSVAITFMKNEDAIKELHQTFYTNETDWGPVDRKSSKQQLRYDHGVAFGPFVEKNPPDSSELSAEYRSSALSATSLEGEADNAAVLSRKTGVQQGNEDSQRQPGSEPRNSDVNREESKSSVMLPDVDA